MTVDDFLLQRKWALLDHDNVIHTKNESHRPSEMFWNMVQMIQGKSVEIGKEVGIKKWSSRVKDKKDAWISFHSFRIMILVIMVKIYKK